MNLIPFIKARYAVLYCLSPEEARVEQEILQAATACKIPVKTWSHTEGFRQPGKEWEDTDKTDPGEALAEAIDDTKQCIWVFRDLHHFFTSPRIVRQIRDIARDFKQSEATKILIITSPVNTIPPELQRDITLIDFNLPNRAMLEITVKKLISSNDGIKNIISSDPAKFPAEVENIIDASVGLTCKEAEDAVSKAIIEKKLTPTITSSVSNMVMKEKALSLKKTGILEYYESTVNADSIGGLDALKSWLEIRKSAFTLEAKAFGLPAPRGYLLVGMPGCGKSLAAKATSAKYGVPLIKFDVGRIFGGLVGQSEANLRTAIQTVEAIGNCVLWIDEIDKAFAGMGSSQSGDSGVSQRIFGNLITWMQEKTAPVFIVATANRIKGLPPEMLRKGRFDEIFFVDLPDDKEREEILKIHVHKRRPKLNLDFTDCVDASKGFSGAEIEEAVISAMYQAFYTNTELNQNQILAAISKTRPLSESRKDDLEEMSSWAKNNAVAASTKVLATKARKLG